MESHLLQMRGLKLCFRKCFRISSVASFTDAWIETKRNMVTKKQILSRIFYRCVD